MQPSIKPTGKISLLALGGALAIGVMFFYGKQSITVDQTGPIAQPSAEVQAVTKIMPTTANEPVIEEMVVTAERIEETPVGFTAPEPKVAVGEPVAPKTFWPQS